MIVSINGYAKVEKIDDNYYRITSENVREIEIAFQERDYYKQRAEEVKPDYSMWWLACGFVAGVIIAK